MKPRTRRNIEPLIYRGSTELGLATGFTSKHTHAKWRADGLEYMVGEDGTFLYEPAKVMAFLKKQFTAQEVKQSLKN